jgi:hypothetical protein
MKNIFIVALMIFSFAAFNATAQIPDNDKKGPQFKNYKPWKNPAQPEEVVIKSSQEVTLGPKFKNQKPGEVSKKVVLKEANTSAADRKVIGPKAKNRRP